MKVLHQYQCEICEAVYENKAGAESCEAQGVEEATFEVGDFVVTETTYGRFGWFDGDPAWVIERDKGHKGEPFKGYSLIYVVTAIVPDDATGWHPHHFCYHLATKAMSGKKGHQQGFNYPDTHYRMYKIEADLDASDLVGRQAHFLL